MLTRAGCRLLVVGLVGGLLASCGARSELFSGYTTENAGGAAAGSDGGAKDLGDAAADGETVACTPGTFDLEKAVPAIMFVLDRSASMSDTFAQGESRWEVLTSALSSTLPSVDTSMEIGALLFPNGNAGGGGRGMVCSVPGTANLTPATGHVAALLSLLAETTPAGGTPTFDALGVASKQLLGIRAATTARAMVLATDGEPNCNAALDDQTCACGQQSCQNDALECLDNARTVQSIASYAAEGLPTYVIGIQSAADTEFTQILDAMAVAGGRPQTGAATSYYAASSESDLESALVTIRDQVSACTFLTTSVPGNQGTITVTIDGVVVPYDPSGQTGWSWGDQSNGQILLAGSACATAAAEASASITAQVGCGVDASAGTGPLDASSAVDATAARDASADGSSDASLDSSLDSSR